MDEKIYFLILSLNLYKLLDMKYVLLSLIIFIFPFTLWSETNSLQLINSDDKIPALENFIQIDNNISYYFIDDWEFVYGYDVESDESHIIMTKHDISFFLKLKNQMFKFSFSDENSSLSLGIKEVVKIDVEDQNQYLLKISTAPDIRAASIPSLMQMFCLTIKDKKPYLTFLTAFSFGHEFGYYGTDFIYLEDSKLKVLLINKVEPYLHLDEVSSNHNEIDFLNYLEDAQLYIDFDEDRLIRKSFKLGIINSNSLRIRADKTLDAKIIGKLNTSDIVYILDKSKEKQQIGNMIDYWYYIYTDEKGISGWIYGSFIDIQKGISFY